MQNIDKKISFTNDQCTIEIVESNEELEYLVKSNINQIKKCKKLILYNSEIINISALSNLRNLKDLALDYNNITDISSLSNLSNLKTLFLHNNNIANISALSNLRNLKYLSLSSNNITDISSLSSLKKLAFLDVGKYITHEEFDEIAKFNPNMTYPIDVYEKDEHLKYALSHFFMILNHSYNLPLVLNPKEDIKNKEEIKSKLKEIEEYIRKNINDEDVLVKTIDKFLPIQGNENENLPNYEGMKACIKKWLRNLSSSHDQTQLQLILKKYSTNDSYIDYKAIYSVYYKDPTILHSYANVVDQNIGTIKSIYNEVQKEIKFNGRRTTKMDTVYGEPSGEPSGKPSGKPSGEPSFVNKLNLNEIKDENGNNISNNNHKKEKLERKKKENKCCCAIF